MLKLEMRGKQLQEEGAEALKRKTDPLDELDLPEKKVKQEEDDNLFSSESDKDEDEQQFIRSCKEYLGIADKKEVSKNPVKTAQEDQLSESDGDNMEKYSESMDEDDDIFVEEFK